MNGFEARYTGVCTGEGDAIKVGDPIEDFDGGYAHPDCIGRAEEPSKPPCTSCWLVHAGECM